MRTAGPALCLLLAACSQGGERPATGLAQDLLTARDGRSVEIRAIHERREHGPWVICGLYGYPLERPPQMAERPFAIVDGQLSPEPPPEALAALIADCRKLLPPPLRRGGTEG